jgi:ABC-type sugar transport system permease subunit
MKKLEKVVPYIFILPFILSFLAFFLFPAIYSFVLSFFQYKGYGTATFIGVDNYVRLLTYRTFWQYLANTVFYFLAHFVPVMALAFVFALAVRSDLIRRYQQFYKPIIFLPQMTASVAAALIFRIVFGGSAGVINQVLGTQVPFLTDLDLIKWPVVALVIWRATGWYFVIYLAGLTTIDDDLIAAAKIDGTTAVQRVVHVVLPIMKPIFMFAFVMDAISSLKIYNEPNLIMNNIGNTPTQAAPYMNTVVDNLQAGYFGAASAAGWLLFVVILVVTMLQFSLFGRGDDK